MHNPRGVFNRQCLAHGAVALRCLAARVELLSAAESVLVCKREARELGVAAWLQATVSELQSTRSVAGPRIDVQLAASAPNADRTLS